MLKKQERKIVLTLSPGAKVKHKRTGETGVIAEVKKGKCFVNYSSYSCSGKVFGVRFRWARSTDLIEVRDMKVNDRVERNGEAGTVMNVVNDIAYVWWHVPGKYKWEPCDITTLKKITADEDIDAIVEKGDRMSEEDVNILVDWVLNYKKTLGADRVS